MSYRTNLYIRRETAENIGATLVMCGSIARYRVFPAGGLDADRSGYRGFRLVVWDHKGRKSVA